MDFDFSDMNWAVFILLCGIGIFVCAFMFFTWKKMNFEISIFTKILTMLLVPVASFFFTKIWFD